MRLRIKASYLWLPVDKDAEQVQLDFYIQGKKINELDIHLGESDFDFYTYVDMSEYIGEELEICTRAAENKLDFLFFYEEKPQNVYPFRPKLHFSPEIGWHNDPNGLVYENGIYHLYYQWNPFGVVWGNMQWGHAQSTDLIHWEHKPAVLFPNETGTMYSGCGFIDKENKTGLGKDALLFYYTAAGGINEWSRKAGNKFTQRLAYSLDGGLTLEHSERFFMEHIMGENRDPKVFYYEPHDIYIMLLYLDGFEFSLYRSKDLLHWEESQRLNFEGMWECPDLFELRVDNDPETTKWIFWSADGFYVVGSFDGFRFEAESGVKKAYIGNLLYAAQTYSNVSNRIISVAWMRMKNDKGNYRGLMSIPTELSLKKIGDDYAVSFAPVRELEQLEGRIHTLEKHTKNFEIPLEKKATKICLKWKKEESGEAHIRLHNIQINIQFEEGKISFAEIERRTEAIYSFFDRSQPLSLMLLIDQEVIDFFGNDGIIYGAVETGENVLRHTLECQSDAEIQEGAWCRFHL